MSVRPSQTKTQEPRLPMKGSLQYLLLSRHPNQLSQPKLRLYTTNSTSNLQLGLNRLGVLVAADLVWDLGSKVEAFGFWLLGSGFRVGGREREGVFNAFSSTLPAVRPKPSPLNLNPKP